MAGSQNRARDNGTYVHPVRTGALVVEGHGDWDDFLVGSGESSMNTPSGFLLNHVLMFTHHAIPIARITPTSNTPTAATERLTTHVMIISAVRTQSWDSFPGWLWPTPWIAGLELNSYCGGSTANKANPAQVWPPHALDRHFQGITCGIRNFCKNHNFRIIS